MKGGCHSAEVKECVLLGQRMLMLEGVCPTHNLCIAMPHCNV